MKNKTTSFVQTRVIVSSSKHTHKSSLTQQPKFSSKPTQLKFEQSTTQYQNVISKLASTSQGKVTTIQSAFVSPKHNQSLNFQSPSANFHQDQMFLVEKLICRNSGSRLSSRGSTAAGSALNNWPTTQSKQTTTFQTRYTNPTPEPQHLSVISTQVAKDFNMKIGQRQQEQLENGQKQIGILKEQQYIRSTQEQPYARGRRNSDYQSPSFTSHEIFYQDYKGNSKPGIIRSQSAEKELRSISKRQSTDQPKKYLFSDGEGRNFTKKTSSNMKNYSSVCLGNNDNIRDIYERSLSKSSIKSCQTQRYQTQENHEKENNQSIGNLEKTSMFQSRKMLMKKLQEEHSHSSMAQTLNQSCKDKASSFVDYKIGQPENKMQWPSNRVTSFRKHNKNIPQSMPMKSLHQSFVQPSNFQQQLIDQAMQQQCQKSKAQNSNSFAAQMTGDQFQNLHQLKEQSRETLRDQVIQKFYQNGNSQLNDTKEKTLFHKNCNSVSLQVGRDDSQERMLMRKELSNFLKGQIDYKSNDVRETSQKRFEEGRKLQEEWAQFKLKKDEEERQKKLHDQSTIRTCLQKIQMEQQARQEKENQEKMKVQEHPGANRKQQVIKQVNQNLSQHISQTIKSKQIKDIDSQSQVPEERKNFEANGINMIYRVKIMNNIHPCKQEKS